MSNNPLISVEQALESFENNSARFLDVTWYVPGGQLDGKKEFENEHIPQAVYFDIDYVCDPSSSLPHMFPSQERFEKCVGELGITASDSLIVYDRNSYISSARAWWLFHSFGHEQVKVLNGGLAAWKRANGPCNNIVPEITPQKYECKPAGDAVTLWEEVVENINNPSEALIDARSQGRFQGTEPEPRPDLRGGHIPGSLNLYYGDLINPDGSMRDGDEIQDLLNDLGVEDNQRIVTTCGSGVTASILLLAIYQFRQDNLSLYDGSWTEWALHPNSPT